MSELEMMLNRIIRDNGNYVSQEKAIETLKYYLKLKEENGRLRECLEYYANENNWSSSLYEEIISEIHLDDLYITEEECLDQFGGETRYRIGGKRARQALKDEA